MHKSVLVTGSSRGIGKAIAVGLADDGFDVVLHCHNNLIAAENSMEMIRDKGRKARLLQFDVSDRQQCQQVLSKDIEKNGPYFGVVCNAGIAMDNAFPSISGDEWDTVLATNLDGFYNVLHPVVMPMIRAKNKGRIVTLASVSGIMGARGQVNYSAAKAGVIGASKALAVELAKRGITVNCVAPGLIETDMITGMPIEQAVKMIPARRLGKPDEVASLVCFLFSAGAAYITRQVISVNGGLV